MCIHNYCMVTTSLLTNKTLMKKCPKKLHFVVANSVQMFVQIMQLIISFTFLQFKYLINTCEFCCFECLSNLQVFSNT